MKPPRTLPSTGYEETDSPFAPEPAQPDTGVTSLGQQLQRALDSAGVDASPTAGRLIGALLAALASSGGDDLVEASLVPGGGRTLEYEVRCYDIGNIVASVVVPRVDAAAAIRTAMAMVIGPDQTAEVVVKEADAEDRCLLVRSFDGAPIYVFEDTAPSLGPRARPPEAPRPPTRASPEIAPHWAIAAAASARDRPAEPPADLGTVRPAGLPVPEQAPPGAAGTGFGPGPSVGTDSDEEPTGPMATVPGPDRLPAVPVKPVPVPAAAAAAADRPGASPGGIPLAGSVDVPRSPPIDAPGPSAPADVPRPGPEGAPPARWSADAVDEKRVVRRQAEVVEQAAIILARLPKAADVADQVRLARRQGEVVEEVATILGRLPDAADVADQVRLARRQGEVVEEVATILGRLPTAADVADAVRAALAESTVSVDLGGASESVPAASATPTADEIAEVVVNLLVSEGRLPQAADPTGSLAVLAPTAEEVADVVVSRLGAIRVASAPDTAAAMADRMQLEMELGRLETDVVREQMQDIRQTLDNLAEAVAASERRLGSRIERLGDALADDVARLRRDVAATRLPEADPTAGGGSAPVTPVQRSTTRARRPPQRKSGA